jgi:hypothetical protein
MPVILSPLNFASHRGLCQKAQFHHHSMNKTSLFQEMYFYKYQHINRIVPMTRSSNFRDVTSHPIDRQVLPA